MKSIIGGVFLIVLGAIIAYFSAKGMKRSETGSFEQANHMKGLGLGVTFILLGIIMICKST